MSGEIETKSVGYHTVHFAKDAEHGYRYLRFDLDSSSEREPFFDDARRDGKRDFEDREGRNFTLSHDSGSDDYTITKR